MNHIYNTKPNFLSIVNRQRIAHYRLTKDPTTRTLAERNDYERKLQAIPADEVELPQIPLVRLKESGDKTVVDGGNRWVILGEIAQTPGKVILLSVADGRIEVSYSTDDLELVPPTELE